MSTIREEVLVSAPSVSPESQPASVRVADVAPEHVEWLWQARVPLGKVTVLDGDPGLGKSTVTLDLAARVSTGTPMPDEQERSDPAAVLMLSAEDGLADTIRPRLDAAGADVTRVHVLGEVVVDGAARLPEIPSDLSLIEREVQLLGARLVVIDPLMAYLTDRVDSRSDHHIRRALSPVAALADATGAAVVVVRHLNKSGGGKAIYRGGGSIGIVGAARSALLVAQDPDDEGRRIVAPMKSNLAAPPPALAFRLVPDEVHGCARVKWDGRTDHNADQLLASPLDDEEKSAVDECAAMVRDLLITGPLPSKEVQRAARDADFSDSTLKRAKARLGVKGRQRAGETGRRGSPGWECYLPESEGQGHSLNPWSSDSPDLGGWGG